MSRANTIRTDLESLEARFRLVLKGYEEAKTHAEQLELVVIARQIATDYRKQIAEYKRIIARPV